MHPLLSSSLPNICSFTHPLEQNFRLSCLPEPAFAEKGHDTSDKMVDGRCIVLGDRSWSPGSRHTWDASLGLDWFLPTSSRKFTLTPSAPGIKRCKDSLHRHEVLLDMPSASRLIGQTVDKNRARRTWKPVVIRYKNGRELDKRK